MASRLQRKMALRRKLQILRTLTNSKSVKKSSIIMDAFRYILKLKLKLEEAKREYSNLMAIKRNYLNLIDHFNLLKEVKVEKAGKGFMVKVRCNKGGDTLVSILEAYEEMGLNVVQARVSCNNCFAMEAIVVPHDQDQAPMDVSDVTQNILKAIGKHGGRGTHTTLEFPMVNNSK